MLLVVVLIDHFKKNVYTSCSVVGGVVVVSTKHVFLPKLKLGKSCAVELTKTLAIIFATIDVCSIINHWESPQIQAVKLDNFLILPSMVLPLPWGGCKHEAIDVGEDVEEHCNA